MTTEAPSSASCRAIPSPRPCAPPVTITTSSRRRSIVFSPLENVEAFPCEPGRRGAAGALFGAQAEGVGADRKILSDRRHSGSGLDGFWLHRVLESEGVESHVVDPSSIATSRRRRRAKTDRIDGEALLRALLAYKRGEPRVCAMVKAPTPEEEDRRRLRRERKVLIAERVKHVNRVKGLLFSQGISGYEPLRRDRRQRLDELTTGDGRPLPVHLKTQIRRELDRLELLLDQIKEAEAERDALLAAPQPAAPAPTGRMSPNSRASAPSWPPSSGWRRYFATLTIAASSRLTLGWRPRPGKAAQSITSRVFPRPGIRDCEPA